MTLVEFLLQRLDEDEQVALAAIEDDSGQNGGFEDSYDKLIKPPSGVGFVSGGFGEAAAHMIATYAVPRRVLAEVAAKRRIIDLHHSFAVNDDGTPDEYASPDDALWCYGCGFNSIEEYRERLPCPTLRLLAAPYSDHPDFDSSWTAGDHT